jgi:flagellar hook assembly protein FlgD
LSPRAYPNPWRADRGYAQQITFDQLAGNTTIKIFTVSGHLIKTLSTGSSSTNWDLTNDSGDRVASGIYIYRVSNDQGQTARGKVVVIR